MTVLVLSMIAGDQATTPLSSTNLFKERLRMKIVSGGAGYIRRRGYG